MAEIGGVGDASSRRRARRLDYAAGGRGDRISVTAEHVVSDGSLGEVSKTIKNKHFFIENGCVNVGPPWPGALPKNGSPSQLLVSNARCSAEEGRILVPGRFRSVYGYLSSRDR
ncbi:hypothetical protein [Mycolicibacterium neoaurum]|uniref:hypothetical protein n=1 Tax=Mycolicibacterium neoaurum TaxID=1795 RepID=UPI00114D4AFF|nr:hypothetical protein [Mycolicibacterium neoaurum]